MNGLIVQWGYTSTNIQSFTFALAFTSGTSYIVTSTIDDNGNYSPYKSEYWKPDTAEKMKKSGSQKLWWIATGY